jgi:DNA-binding MarR family transcriptional regulator
MIDQTDSMSSAWRDVPESGEGLRMQDFLGYRLGRLSTLVQRETTQKYLEPAGLSQPEWRVLSRISRYDSIEMRQLTQVSLMDKAAISRTVAVLLEKGLAERHVDPLHAKRRIVAITPAGRRLIRKVLPAALREQARLLRLLNTQERVVLDSALSKLTAALLQGSAPERNDTDE